MTRKNTAKTTTNGAATKLGTTKVKAADLKPIRKRFMPPVAPAPAAPPAPPKRARRVRFDVTRRNAHIAITSPRTGETRHLKVITQPDTSTFRPGERVAYLFVGTDMTNVRHWRGFAGVDEFGCHVFGTCKGKDIPSLYERLAGMLERPEFFENKGCKYKVKFIK